MAHAGYPNGLGITEQEILKKLETDNDCNRRLILEISAAPVGEMNYSTVEKGRLRSTIIHGETNWENYNLL